MISAVESSSKPVVTDGKLTELPGAWKIKTTDLSDPDYIGKSLDAYFRNNDQFYPSPAKVFGVCSHENDQTPATHDITVENSDNGTGFKMTFVNRTSGEVEVMQDSLHHGLNQPLLWKQQRPWFGTWVTFVVHPETLSALQATRRIGQADLQSSLQSGSSIQQMYGYEHTDYDASFVFNWRPRLRARMTRWADSDDPNYITHIDIEVNSNS